MKLQWWTGAVHNVHSYILFDDNHYEIVFIIPNTQYTISANIDKTNKIYQSYIIINNIISRKTNYTRALNWIDLFLNIIYFIYK